MSCADFLYTRKRKVFMRYEEQLDAHVQSYREELKRKECERIKKILQYLKEKKEYLSLEGHPVKRIHYSFEMVKPIYSLPLIKRLLSFDNKVELHIENIIPQRNYEISNISISEYRCSEIDTPSLSNINFDGFEFEVPNTEYIFPFSVDISTTKILFNPSFQKIDLKTFNNKGNDRNLIYRFTLPEVDTCDSIFRFTGQLYNYNKFDFKPPISKAVLLFFLMQNL